MKCAVIMGSKSDLPIAQKCVAVLESLGVEHIVRVMSAHRTPNEVRDFALSAKEQGVGVIVAIAGMAAHLAGVVAAYTRLPVIGVPAGGGTLGGVDALLSTAQMPPGVPVACVGVNAGANAAYLAARILAVSDEALAGRLEAEAVSMAEKVSVQDSEVQNELS